MDDLNILKMYSILVLEYLIVHYLDENTKMTFTQTYPQKNPHRLKYPQI